MKDLNLHIEIYACYLQKIICLAANLQGVWLYSCLNCCIYIKFQFFTFIMVDFSLRKVEIWNSCLHVSEVVFIGPGGIYLVNN